MYNMMDFAEGLNLSYTQVIKSETFNSGLQLLFMSNQNNVCG